MIGYEQFLQLRKLLDEEKCSARRAAEVLGLNVKTVLSWADRMAYTPRRMSGRASLLDAYKDEVVRRLHQHPYSATQVFQQLREQGYTGGYSILKEFIRQVRPRTQAAFLTLHFAPGECAQIDWGYAGGFMVGATRRRLSFLVLVLCHSRRMYVEFTLSETLEQFLAAQQNAFQSWGGAPKKLMIDNLKSAVLSHPRGQPAVYNPHYLDFAGHYGCALRACNVRAAHEKGRVENGVGYVKKNFLAGRELTGSLAGLNALAARWLDEVANVRLHGETKRKPLEAFEEEKAALTQLPPALYDVARPCTVHATRRCRVSFDGNRYSVPPEHAGRPLTLNAYPDRVLLCHDGKIIAEHVRSYERNADIENPDHTRLLLARRPRAQEQQLLERFLRLTPLAEEYLHQLEQHRVHAATHVRKIVALCDIYGQDEVVRALLDTHELRAYSSEYIANLLEQRRRLREPPGPLHLTRGQDLLQIDLPEPDLSLYQPGEQP